MAHEFGSDAVMLYDIAPWNKLGFGVAHFGGDNVGTLNRPVANLVDEIGQVQLFIMTHKDAMRKQPPSRNTIERFGKLINRVVSVLAGRMKGYDELRLEPGHASPATKIWNIHPVPYFPGPIVRNRYMQEYNDLIMMALVNIFQHSDNNLALTITKDFAQDIWQFFRELKYRMGSELLQIPMDELRPDEFRFTEAHFAAYDPSGVTLRVEAIDYPGPLFNLPTEDDLKPLLNGVPAVLIIPHLKQFPVSTVPGASGDQGVALDPAEGTTGVAGGEAIGSPSV